MFWPVPVPLGDGDREELHRGTSKNSFAAIFAALFPSDCVVVSHHTTEGMPPSSALPDEKTASESDDAEYLEVPIEELPK